jgi:ribosomal protein S18 acetylase RimI-like enzyme
MRDMSLTIGFRPITDDDQGFLYELYASTRQDEMQLVPWSDAEKEAFLRMQFTAQHKHYQEHYADAEYLVVLREDQPIGRLYVDRRETELRVLDIALLPEHRGQGIGGRLMRDLLAEAAAAGKAVRIHVEHNNPAMRLYDRLGFVKIDENGVYYLMEWTPGEADG